jgi:ABC-2 type transport system permease protein
VNLTIIELTARQLLGKKRTILLLLLALLPGLIAVAYRVSGSGDRVIVDGSTLIDQQARWTAGPLMSRLVVSLLLPLCALVFGTAAIGSEIEDGTAVYLLSKPIARWRVILSKLLVAWVATLLIVIPAAAIAGFIAMAGAGGHVGGAVGGTVQLARGARITIPAGVTVTVESGFGVLPAFLVALVAGSFIYTALFVALSIFTSRALIAGLLYVFFWEALLTSLFGGLRIFSVRQYTLGIAHSLANVSESVFTTKLDGPEALALLLLASVAAIALGIRRLQSWEVGEST